MTSLLLGCEPQPAPHRLGVEAHMTAETDSLTRLVLNQCAATPLDSILQKASLDSTTRVAMPLPMRIYLAHGDCRPIVEKALRTSERAGPRRLSADADTCHVYLWSQHSRAVLVVAAYSPTNNETVLVFQPS